MLDVRLAPSAVSADPVDLPETPDEVRERGGRVARALPPGRSAVGVDGLSGARLAAFVEGLVLGAYRYTERTKPQPAATVVDLVGAGDTDADRQALEHGRRAGEAAVWARDLANTRSSTKTPAWLAGQAVATLTPAGVTVLEHDEHWLAEHGFGGVLAVGGGSASPPRLIEATWRPKRSRDAGPHQHLVLIGKGITFDTGGLNRKQGDGMLTMYTDMAGGAAVLGALRAVAKAQLPVRVTALVPCAENSLSGSSYRPGDVVRHYGGRTSEVQNTDAEGRMVLADAMAYAAARLKPDAMVDIATLTGAVRVSLGTRTAGLFASDDAVAAELVAAGELTGESLWRLPMPVEYEGLLHSDVADATNAPGNPGAITAALFLRPFAGSVPWAHLDIAGTGRASADDGILSRGATGFGARLLARWVEARAELPA